MGRKGTGVFADGENRRRALELFSSGLSQGEVAAEFGICTNTILRWLRVDPAAHVVFALTRPRPTLQHGTVNGYQHYACRCDACTAANTKHHRAWMAAAADRTPPEHVHGTTTGYTQWRCRCDSCRAAGSRANRQGRLQRMGTEPRKHGLTGYKSYGCRCDVCMQAAREYDRGRRERTTRIA